MAVWLDVETCRRGPQVLALKGGPLFLPSLVPARRDDPAFRVLAGVEK